MVTGPSGVVLHNGDLNLCALLKLGKTRTCAMEHESSVLLACYVSCCKAVGQEGAVCRLLCSLGMQKWF